MERVKEGEYSQCTLYTCMKIEQLNLLSGVTRKRENDWGVNFNKIHCKLIWKYHNEQLIYANKMF
jgi:hypothetical protein